MAKVIPPFYEPGAPPAPLPLLTSQTDLFYNSPPQATIVAMEEFPPNISDFPKNVTFSTGGVTRTSKGVARRAHKPYSKPPHVTSAHNSNIRVTDHFPNQPEDDIESEEEEDDDDDDDDEDMIPKPAGEAGRPGRGGYNLKDALEWDSKALKKLRVCNCLAAVFDSTFDTI